MLLSSYLENKHVVVIPVQVEAMLDAPAGIDVDGNALAKLEFHSPRELTYWFMKFINAIDIKSCTTPKPRHDLRDLDTLYRTRPRARTISCVFFGWHPPAPFQKPHTPTVELMILQDSV